MSTVEERNEFLKLEKTIIKNLLLSRINKDGKEDIHMRYLKEAMKGHNALIKEYFSSKKNLNGPEEMDISLLTEENFDEFVKEAAKNQTEEDHFYALYRDYLNVLMDKQALVKKYTVEKDLKYQRGLISFLAEYEIHKRLLEITEWYFANNEDDKHNIEQFATVLTDDSDRLFVFRNELIGKKIGLDLTAAELNTKVNNALLICSLKMNLCGNISRGNIGMIKALDDDKDRTEAISGIILFDLLVSAATISVAKEYGYEEKDLDIENLTKGIRETVDYFPTAVGYEDNASEVDNLAENAFKLAKKFDNYKTARLS